MASHQPPPSNVPIYAALLFALGTTTVCLTSLMGAAVIYAIAAVVGVIALGMVHYALWGRWLAEGTNREDNPQ